jgi:hypothetical protein
MMEKPSSNQEENKNVNIQSAPKLPPKRIKKNCGCGNKKN